MNSTDIVTIVQQNIDPGGPGILAINKLLLPPPLPRTNNVVRRTDSKQLRAGAGGTEAIQYSNTGTAALAIFTIFIDSPSALFEKMAVPHYFPLLSFANLQIGLRKNREIRESKIIPR